MRAGSKDHILLMLRYRYYVFLLTTTTENKRVWNTLEEFDRAADRLVKKLITSAFLDETLNEKNIRYLARNEPWRSVWAASLKTGNLFDRPLFEMTDYQRVLVSWSIIYDNAYESMEPPTDEIADNDDLFDTWLREQSEKRKQKQEKQSFDRGMNPSVSKHKEIGIIAESAEDAQRVYNLNDQQTKQKIANRQKAIQEKGILKESELPDVKKDLRMRTIPMAADKLKGLSP